VSGLPQAEALLRPRIVLPFLTISLIWGSTWFVITGQIAGVAAEWSVAWRFMLATPAMFALALMSRANLRLPAPAHRLALAIGLCQFAGNYNLVYQAERHLTSGIVAVMVGLMIVSNAVLGLLVLRQPITRRFALGSLIAIGGIALLLVHEGNAVHVGGSVGIGAALAVGGMLGASISNVLQAGKVGRSVPLMALLAWSMLYGTAIDSAIAWAVHGPPHPPAGAVFWAGTAYLALAGSVVTFPLYFRLIREIGAGRAAYHNVLVVIVAMILSTVLEGYRWSPLAGAGCLLALAGLVIALGARNGGARPALRENSPAADAS
jgi:drug/metabolite transporter (DMT)-like permease